MVSLHLCLEWIVSPPQFITRQRIWISTARYFINADTCLRRRIAFPLLRSQPHRRVPWSSRHLTFRPDPQCLFSKGPRSPYRHFKFSTTTSSQSLRPYNYVKMVGHSGLANQASSALKIELITLSTFHRKWTGSSQLWQSIMPVMNGQNC